MNHFAKSISLIILLLLTVGEILYAQVPIRVGVDAGINYANQIVASSFSYDLNYRRGLIAGGLVEIGVGGVWYIQAEPRYIQKGWTDIYNITSPSGPELLGTFEGGDRLSYFELPLLLKLRFETGKLKPLLFAGPNFGFLLSAEEIGAFDVQQQNQTPVDVKDAYKSLDISVDIGAGAEYEISKTVSLVADVRYSKGQMDVHDHVNHPYGNPYVTSYGIQMVIGTLFSF